MTESREIFGAIKSFVTALKADGHSIAVKRKGHFKHKRCTFYARQVKLLLEFRQLLLQGRKHAGDVISGADQRDFPTASPLAQFVTCLNSGHHILCCLLFQN